MQLRLVAERVATGRDAFIQAGLQVRLEPGWIFYWRTPGDGGLSPDFDWSGSRNVGTVDVRWPLPGLKETGDLVSYGYHDQVLLPLTVQAERPGRAMDLSLRLDYGVCAEICIPYSHTVTLSLPVGIGLPPDSAMAPALRAAAQSVPAGPESVGWQAEDFTVRPGPVVEVRVRGTQPFDRPVAILEGPPAFGFRPAIVVAGTDTREILVRVPVQLHGNDMTALAGVPLTLTLSDGALAAEIHGFAARVP